MWHMFECGPPFLLSLSKPVYTSFLSLDQSNETLEKLPINLTADLDRKTNKLPLQTNDILSLSNFEIRLVNRCAYDNKLPVASGDAAKKELPKLDDVWVT